MKKTSYILIVIFVIFVSAIVIKRQTRINRLNSKPQQESSLDDLKLRSEEKITEEPLKVTIKGVTEPAKVQNVSKKDDNETIKMDLLNSSPYAEGIITDIMNLKTEKEEQKQMLADATLDLLVEVKKITDSDLPAELKKGKTTEIFRMSQAISNRVDKNIRKDYLSIVWGKSDDSINGKRLDQAVEEKYQDVLRVLFAAGGHKNVELDEETDKMVDYYIYELVRGQFDNPNYINTDEAEGHYNALMLMLSKLYDSNQLKAGIPGKFWFKI